MDNIYNVRGGRGGDAYLLVGNLKTALIDCGMAYCASNLIKNIKQILKSRPLDYVLLSHSHYDHIGAVPYLKKEWPRLNICGAEHDQLILKRPTALKAIRELSQQAAEIYAQGLWDDYDDDFMKIDTVLAEGELIDLGNLKIQVLETPGHTRSTLSFWVNGEILFASESTGTLNQSGKFYPAFLVSYAQTIASIQKCQRLHPKFIYSPHYGLVHPSDMPNYWQNCRLAVERSRSFILHCAELGYSEEMILAKYEKVFRDPESDSEQPINAFRINTHNMIQAVLNDRNRSIDNELNEGHL